MMTLILLTLLSILTGWLVTILAKSETRSTANYGAHTVCAMIILWIVMAGSTLSDVASAAPYPEAIYAGVALFWTAVYLLVTRLKR